MFCLPSYPGPDCPGDCWIETSNMLNYRVAIKMKVSEYFRGAEDLDKAVIAAADDDWGQLD